MLPTKLSNQRKSNFILQFWNNYIVKPDFIEKKINSIRYEDLSPTSDINDGTYSEALRWALENPNIKNIAITGPYGSGKSSILKSFEEKNRDIQFLNISLATFKKENIEIIELSILQQITYQKKYKKLPDSRFRKIRILKSWYLPLISFLFTLWLILLTILIKPNYINNNLLLSKLTPNEKSPIFILDIVLLFGGFVYLFFVTFNALKKINLGKLNIFKGEFEVNKDAELSIFNKNLDEILYFFEVTNYDVVILEDLDRFQEEIYPKLREINSLINNSEQINRRVVFIYAVKDEMFTANDRTKFFDFIIPIIPVINNSNSRDKLLINLIVPELGISISEEFINEVSFYIDDMRILKNIRNEFIIYQEKLNVLSLNQDKLLAMIIYKNIFPKDFADLHINKGMIYSVFNHKNELKKTITEICQQKIEELKNNINIAKIEHLTNIKELRAVYLFAFQELINTGVSSINGHVITEMKNDNYFNEFKKSKNITYNGYSTNIPFKNIEKAVDPLKTFDDREKYIYDKSENGLKQINQEIEKQLEEIEKIKYLSLKEIIQLKGKEYSLTKEVLENNLLVYLLRYGYIDENYHTYISIFYEGSLMYNDKLFALSITDQQPLAFDYKLERIKNIIPLISLNNFGGTSVLNYSLVDHLLENKDLYHDQINHLFIQLQNKDKVSLNFIFGYIIHGERLNSFIKTLCQTWPTIWKFIVNQEEYSSERKDLILALIIKYSDIDNIQNLNIDSLLSQYIEQKEDFLTLIQEEEYIPVIKKVIEILNIRFEAIKAPDNAIELFYFMYENYHYKINQHMIQVIIEAKGKDIDFKIKDLRTSNLTTILNSGTSLIEYIRENINDYLSEVFFKLSENLHESQETIIELLNNIEIDHDTKKKIIEKEETIITNIDEVSDKDTWELLFANLKIEPSWDNILYYFETNREIDESLIYYLNIQDNYEMLSATSIEYSSDIFYGEIRSELAEKLILCENISNDSFEYLILGIPYLFSFDDSSFYNLAKEKVNALIRHDNLNFNLENYFNIKAKFDKQHILFIERNINTFLSNIRLYKLDTEDYELLFESSKIINRNKELLIVGISAINIMDSSKLSKSLLEILSETTHIEIGYDELLSLIKQCGFSNQIIELITRHLPYLTQENTTEILGMLGEPYSYIAKLGKKPKINNNNVNSKFLRELHRKNYISSFREDKDKFRIYTKTIR